MMAVDKSYSSMLQKFVGTNNSEILCNFSIDNITAYLTQMLLNGSGTCNIFTLDLLPVIHSSDTVMSSMVSFLFDHPDSDVKILMQGDDGLQNAEFFLHNIGKRLGKSESSRIMVRKIDRNMGYNFITVGDNSYRFQPYFDSLDGFGSFFEVDHVRKLKETFDKFWDEGVEFVEKT